MATSVKTLEYAPVDNDDPVSLEFFEKTKFGQDLLLLNGPIEAGIFLRAFSQAYDAFKDRWDHLSPDEQKKMSRVRQALDHPEHVNEIHMHYVMAYAPRYFPSLETPILAAVGALGSSLVYPTQPQYHRSQ